MQQLSQPSRSGQMLLPSRLRRGSSLGALGLISLKHGSEKRPVSKSFQSVNAISAPSAAIATRNQQRELSAFHEFRMKGVSFEDRQNFVKNLETDQAVILIHEPTNPHDPHAIAIKLLNGNQLGYVPKDINQLPPFRRPEDFGHIRSSGPAARTTEPELYGASIYHQPHLEPLVAYAIPESIHKTCANLHNGLPKAIWDHISASNLQAANGRCAISGAENEELAVVPVWESDERNQKIVLKGFRAISVPLKAAQDAFLQGRDADKDSTLTFQAMNGWTSNEANAYRNWKKQVVEERNNVDWNVDLSLLNSLDLKGQKY